MVVLYFLYSFFSMLRVGIKLYNSLERSDDNLRYMLLILYSWCLYNKFWKFVIVV